VLDHLTEGQRPVVARKLNAAYALEDYAAAKQALDTLHRELMEMNPSAARSLGEGLEETLTVHRLHVPPQLRDESARSRSPFRHEADQRSAVKPITIPD
jgi:hypothetical protein